MLVEAPEAIDIPPGVGEGLLPSDERVSKRILSPAPHTDYTTGPYPPPIEHLVIGNSIERGIANRDMRPNFDPHNPFAISEASHILLDTLLSGTYGAHHEKSGIDLSRQKFGFRIASFKRFVNGKMMTIEATQIIPNIDLVKRKEISQLVAEWNHDSDEMSRAMKRLGFDFPLFAYIPLIFKGYIGAHPTFDLPAEYRGEDAKEIRDKLAADRSELYRLLNGHKVGVIGTHEYVHGPLNDSFNQYGETEEEALHVLAKTSHSLRVTWNVIKGGKRITYGVSIHPNIKIKPSEVLMQAKVLELDGVTPVIEKDKPLTTKVPVKKWKVEYGKPGATRGPESAKEYSAITYTDETGAHSVYTFNDLDTLFKNPFFSDIFTSGIIKEFKSRVKTTS